MQIQTAYIAQNLNSRYHIFLEQLYFQINSECQKVHFCLLQNSLNFISRKVDVQKKMLKGLIYMENLKMLCLTG